MDPVRIADLLAPFVTEEQRVQLEPLIPCISTYIDILLRWNARINLTAIRDSEEIVARHFGESLFAARHLFPNRTLVATAAFGCPAERSPVEEGTFADDRPTHHEGSPRNGSPSNGSQSNGSQSNGSQSNGSQSNCSQSNGSQSNGSQSNGSQSNGSQSNGSQRNGSQSNGSQSNRGRAALQGRVTGAEELGALAPVTVADVGSGAGFPGIPLKLWVPEISLTLIESNHKKATFLREIARALRLTDINIQNARAETLPQAAFDIVTLRAVERFETILPITSSLVKPAGRLALLIGTSQLAQAQAALRGKYDDFQSIPIPQSFSRLLVIAHRT